MELGLPSFTKTYHNKPYPAIDPISNQALSAVGKTVLITGGTGGVGKSIAEAFVAAGAENSIIVARSIAKLEATTQILTSAATGDTKVSHYTADVCDPAAITSLFKTIRLQHGPVDVIALAHGYVNVPTSVAEVQLDAWLTCFEVNVKGTFICIQAFLNYLLDPSTPAPATLIELATLGVHMPSRPLFSGYTSSKIAAWRLAVCLQVEWKDKLRVFCIHPGLLDTQMTRKVSSPALDDLRLPGAFCAWLVATREADFLCGRLVWANWAVDELLARKDQIVKDDLLTMKLTGFGM